MFRRKQSQRARERATEYATCKDFQQIFKEDMAGLHLLAYLLTADQQKAEQCFVAGLEDSIHGNPVFKQWARSWSKRAIIQNAIKTMSPTLAHDDTAPGSPQPGPPDHAAIARSATEESPLVSLVLQWTSFERFVFVMSVLEGYAVRECATLLSCTDQEIIATRSRLLERLANGNWQGAAVLSSPRWLAMFVGAQVA
jgi:DNA-directed RNA polymerase specialized sigma24 family protein